MRANALLLAWAVAAAVPGAASAAERTLPGLRPDGTTLLHNQWPIRPAGDQVGLGDFPINVAVDPAGGLAAVLHAGHGAHEVRIVDIRAGRVVAAAPLHETFCGIAFSSDGKSLVCSGASDGVLHVFSLADGRLVARGDVAVTDKSDGSVVAGFALSRDLKSAVVALAFDSRVVRLDMQTGARRWTAQLGRGGAAPASPSGGGAAPKDILSRRELVADADPLNVVWDEGAGRAYVSLWGESSVAVVDSADGRLLGRWPTGLHPNEMVLSPDGRLFVSNGGLNTVAVLDTRDGRATEVLSSAVSPGEPPGSTPDSLALSPDAKTLYVANAYTNTIAVFDVGVRGEGRPLGFIPTGWFPASVRMSPDGRTLLVLSARGLVPRPSGGKGEAWSQISELYRGSLGIIALPAGGEFARALGEWTRVAQRCRPAPPEEARPGDPIPGRVGGPTPIRYVVYVIKENRTYDQVLGDVPQGNGDPAICLFPEKVTPNIHAIARQFVLLDNFYANAEVSASGHEWSMAGYASEFVEKTWPVNYGHEKRGSHIPYTGEGHFAAAVPASGYLWDRAAAAGVTYRSYGEFTVNPEKRGQPVVSNLRALQGHVDPSYRGWDIRFHDRDRASEFIAELHRFEASGDMPRLQIVRLPQDHTSGAKRGEWTPEAMVADNDLALGRVVEALSLSRFWPHTAVFAVEDDAQDGADHVDAHRTEALVAGPFVRHGAVDSTPYTTCSMLRTIELILGLDPMSQFDAAAAPMRASFQPQPDLSAFRAVKARINIEERNRRRSPWAAISSRFDLSREDAVDERAFNQVIWAAVRGDEARAPAPVHAAFVRPLPGPGGDRD
ncbi:MAG TPA: alkaline phosphatase family protein [Opitutaceae bacterium]|nr:alkaline phosphatase family protein [Opitutaceae bacterium]